MTKAQKKSNVVQLHKPAPVTIPLTTLDSYQGIKMLSSMIRTWERRSRDNTVKLLAKRVGLLPATISRIMAGETKAPRMHTILALWQGIGFVAIRLEVE